jgi:flagellar L-ring protein precursor FlgH
MKMMSLRRVAALSALTALMAGMLAVPCANAKEKRKTTPAELRTDYIARLQEQEPVKPEHTVGSLWTSNDLSDLSSDYKARKVNDTVVILVSVQTTAAQSGNVTSQRTFQTASAITGLAGQINTAGLNPLLNANSATALKGAGSTDSSTTFQTSMTAQVIAVLPSGNLVVEAQRKIFMNNQHEDVTVRGVVRPKDIGPNNTVPSAALSNLELEMKGKGIIADSTRPPNRIMKALLWLVGF